MMPRHLARFLRPRTIRGKLMLLSASGLLTAVVVVFALILYQQQRLIKDEWAASLSAQARLVATDSQAALAFMDRHEADRLLSAVESNPSILRARLTIGDDRRVFAEFVRPESERYLSAALPEQEAGTDVRFGDRLMTVWAVVPGTNEARAQVELTTSLDTMHQALLHTALESGLVLLTALGVSLWLAVQVARRLSSPIERISRLVTSISVDATLKDRVEVHGRDEIARLGRGLNEMIDTLQARDRELAEYRQNLEYLVEVRTRELSLATEEAHEATRFQQVLMDAVPAPIFYKNADRVYIGCNQAFEQYLGLPLDHLIGRTVYDISPADLAEKYDEADRELLKNPSVQIYEGSAVYSDGTRHDVIFNKATFTDIEGKVAGLIGVILDITDRKQIQEQLERAIAAADAANNAKSDFLARMSHEIRTPMNVIIGLSKLLLQTRLNVQQRDYQEKVLASSDALLGVINDILDYSRIEAGKLSLESIPFDLNNVLHNVSSLVTLKAQEKGLELLFLIDSAVPRQLIGDPLRLGQILVNLTSNAVKFTEKGEVVVHVELPREQATDRIALSFSVRDTGIGIPTENLADVFAPFTQVDGSISRRFGGSGLGLAICKQLTGMMGGCIDVSSTPGVGSRFHFIVEFGLASDQAATKGHSPQLKNKHVLVIDDNGSARAVLCEMLQQFGMRTETCPGGIEGLARLGKAAEDGDPFQLVLIDWMMPGMDGIETVRRIREDSAVLATTTGGHDKAIHQLSAVGVKYVLTKPVSQSALHDNILEALFGTGEADAYHRNRTQDYERQYDFSAIRNAPVLLVDDIELNRFVALAFLRKAGVRADIAVNGRDALKKIAERDYAMVLMDIQMPEMDGLTAAREIRKNPRYRDLPVVAMTADAMSGDRERSLDAGMNDHLTKPIDPQALFAALLRWIKPQPTTVDDNLDATLVQEGGHVKIPVLDGIDTDRGLVNHGGMPELYRSILAGFNHEFGSTAEDITSALASGDYPLARRLAHSLKSVAATIGADNLSSCAKVLEERYAAEKPADEEFRCFATALRNIIRSLAPLTEKGSNVFQPSGPDRGQTDDGSGNQSAGPSTTQARVDRFGTT